MKKEQSSLGYASDSAEQRRLVAGNNALDDDMDISLLQRPLRTACTGFQEAKRAFEDGTSEVRRLLMQECSLIYECNVCRNMFRSLANFISHKRVFCTNSFTTCGYYNSGSDENQHTSIIVPAQTTDLGGMKRSRSMGSSPTPTEGRSNRGSLRDLSHVIERLRREKETVDEERTTGGETVLQLESVPTSNHAVYQTVKRQDHNLDSIKTEVNELHDLLSNIDTVLGPDGKAVNKSNFTDGNNVSDEYVMANINQEEEAKLICETCKLTFQTEKMLKIHIQKKHSLSAYVFQCPACSLTFLQAAAVIRHLSKEHKKPTRRIRLMRDSILKRCIQQGDVQIKGPSRELKRLQMGDAPADTSQTGEQRKIMSSCIYCEKSFERRAALSTHLLNCRAKQEALQKPVKRSKLIDDATSATEKTKADKDDYANVDIKYTEEANSSIENIEQTIIKQESDGENSNLLNEMFADLAVQQSFSTALQTVSLEMLEGEEANAAEALHSVKDEHDESQMLADERQQEVNNKTKDDKLKKKTRNVPVEKQLKCRCKICNKQFNALSNVRRHISMFHYRARRFGCKLCEYRAFRRYDIVNHLGFVHKMEDEREKLSVEFVTTHDCKYSKDDVDGDIVLLGEESATEVSTVEQDEASGTKIKVIKTYEKRVRRKKPDLEKDNQAESIEQSEVKTPSRGKQRRSYTDDDTNPKDGEKRPIRKRVKAENKDFVYDLSRLLKTEVNAQPVEAGRPKRRMLSVDCDGEQRTLRASLPKHWDALITESSKEQVRGTTRRLMLQLVSQGLAVSATLPELPAERPQIRPRLTSQLRNSEPNNKPAVVSPIIELDTVNVERPKSIIFNDSFIEKIAKRTAAAAASSTEQSPIDHLMRKVDAAQQQGGISEQSGPTSDPTTMPPIDTNTELAQPLATDEFYQHTLMYDAQQQKTPNGKLYVDEQPPLTPPCPPRKRIAASPLPAPTPPIQSYMESTLESLLRTALQN